MDYGSALVLLLWALNASACSSVGDPGFSVNAIPADAGPTYEDADWVFDPERLLSIQIDITEDRWDTLRFQTRDIFAILGDACGTKPAYSPFTYVVATVTVDGEAIQEVGVRKKGFMGSLDDNKPALKIKFDEYIPDQNLSGLTRLTLNNGKQDPSYMDQCLGYELFRQAGVVAPRCNFAEVSVNGRSLGIYANVESIKKPFLAQHFDDNGGNLYEGTQSDFRDGWHRTLERKTNKSDPPGSEDIGDVEAIVDALAQDDAAMLADLEQLVDLEAFYSFWAVETIVSHWDGYAGSSNNFFMYGDPTSGKFTFMPWGADQLFGEYGGDVDPGLTRSLMTRRLFLYGPSRARYLERYEEILDTVFDDAELLAEIDRIEALISPWIPADELEQFTTGVAQLRAFIDGRESGLRNRLADTGPGDADQLVEPPCFERMGTLAATFSLPWNGGEVDDVTLAIEVDGTSLVLGPPSGAVGASGGGVGRSFLHLVAQTDDNRRATAFFDLADELCEPGVIQVGDGLAESAVVFIPEGAEEPDEVYLLSGTMTLGSGGAWPGSLWQGSLDLELWDVPWL